MIGAALHLNAGLAHTVVRGYRVSKGTVRHPPASRSTSGEESWRGRVALSCAEAVGGICARASLGAVIGSVPWLVFGAP